MMWLSLLHSILVGFLWGKYLLILILIFLTIIMNIKKIHLADINSKSIKKKAALFLKSKIINLTNNYHLIVLIAGTIFLFSLLFSTRFLLPQNGLWYSGGSSWGDLALHLALITHFVSENFPKFTSPIYANYPNTYPWLFDFYTGWLTSLGFTLRDSLLISSFQALIAFLLGFFALTKNLRFSKISESITYLSFIFAGGAGYLLAIKDWQISGSPALNFFVNLSKNYTNNPENFIYFSNPIADMLLPQRGFLAGLPIFLLFLLMSLFWLKYQNKVFLILTTIILGMMPLIHIHLFLTGCGFLILIFLYQIYFGVQLQKLKITFFQLLSSCILLIIMTAPQLGWFLQTEQSSHFINLDWLWMYDLEKSTSIFDIFQFFLLNFSIVFFLALFRPLLKKFFIKPGKLSPEQNVIHSWLSILWFGMVGILILTLSIRFQPNDYDNIKFLMPALLFACLLSGEIMTFLKQKSLRLIIVLLVLSLGFNSGILATLYELGSNHVFVSSEQLNRVEMARAYLPKNAILATAPAHRDELNMLGGYAVYVGYPGWLWTHGIQAGEREETLRRAYAGDLTAIKKLSIDGVSHLIIREKEREVYNLGFIWQDLTPVYADSSFFIYALADVKH